MITTMTRIIVYAVLPVVLCASAALAQTIERNAIILDDFAACLPRSAIATESVNVAKAMAITGAIPFTVIIIMQLAAFFRVVREDPMVRESHTEVRHPDAYNQTEKA